MHKSPAQRQTSVSTPAPAPAPGTKSPVSHAGPSESDGGSLSSPQESALNVWPSGEQGTRSYGTLFRARRDIGSDELGNIIHGTLVDYRYKKSPVGTFFFSSLTVRDRAGHAVVDPLLAEVRAVDGSDPDAAPDGALRGRSRKRVAPGAVAVAQTGRAEKKETDC